MRRRRAFLTSSEPTWPFPSLSKPSAFSALTLCHLSLFSTAFALVFLTWILCFSQSIYINDNLHVFEKAQPLNSAGKNVLISDSQECDFFFHPPLAEILILQSVWNTPLWISYNVIYITIKNMYLKLSFYWIKFLILYVIQRGFFNIKIVIHLP